jgi:hypothetical protein
VIKGMGGGRGSWDGSWRQRVARGLQAARDPDATCRAGPCSRKRGRRVARRRAPARS